MRAAATLLFVLASALPVGATPSRALVASYGLDPELVPPTCRWVVTGTRMGARISVASCASRLALEKLELDDSPASVAVVERAVRWSAEVFDSVIAAGNPLERVVALHGRADQLDGMVARIRRTAPNLMWHTTGQELASAQDKHGMIEAAIAPWTRDAAAANDAIVQLARQHPDIRQDPVAAIAVKAAEDAIRARVASR